MTIAVGQIDAQRLLSLRPAASHFGQPELEAVGAVYANTMFRLGNGIEDRLAARFHIIGHHKASPAAIDVDLEMDVREDRLMHFFKSRSENVEDGCAGHRILTT